MGCIFCNITQMKKSLFYMNTKKERLKFADELAYDIAAKHPEVRKRVNKYARRLRERRNLCPRT